MVPQFLSFPFFSCHFPRLWDAPRVVNPGAKAGCAPTLLLECPAVMYMMFCVECKKNDVNCLILWCVSPDQRFCSVLWSPQMTCVLSGLPSYLWRQKTQKYIAERYHCVCGTRISQARLMSLCLVAESSCFGLKSFVLISFPSWFCCHRCALAQSSAPFHRRN